MTKKILQANTPVDYVAEMLSCDNFSHLSDVHIKGDVDIDDQLIVGGNLTVEGNLTALNIICFGNITVSGSINGSNLFVTFSVRSGSTINVCYINTGFSKEDLSSSCEIEIVEDESWLEQFIHPELLDDYLDRRAYRPDTEVVFAKGDVICFGLFTIGDVEIGGILDTDIAHIEGSLTVGKVMANEDLFVWGYIDCKGDLWGEEIKVSGDIDCGGLCKAVSLKVEDGDISIREFLYVYDDIVTPGNIQVGRWIGSSGHVKAGKFIKAGESIVGEKSIQAGADYGILAGLCTPRSKWLDRGFVSSKGVPENILSGTYVKDIDAETLWSKEQELRGKKKVKKNMKVPKFRYTGDVKAIKKEAF